MGTTYDSASVIRAQRRKKELAVKRFGGECQICGYKRCLAALEFHHTANDKAASPSYVIGRRSWRKAKVELEKCVLLCANCHREVEYGLRSSEELKALRLPFHTVHCLCCNKPFDTKDMTQQFCSQSCSHLNNRRVVRPTKKELQTLINTLPMTQIGRMFSVSDNAVRKWAKTLGCKL